MGTFGRAFWGGFFGKLTVVLFIAACAAFGFGPNFLVSFMIAELPTWVTPFAARLAFLTLGPAAAIAIITTAIRQRGKPDDQSLAADPPAVTAAMPAVVKSEDRALVGIADVTIDDSPLSPSISYTLKNQGRAPASGLTHCVWVLMRGQGRFDDPIPVDLAPNNEFDWRIINAGASISATRLLLERYVDPDISQRIEAPPVASAEDWQLVASGIHHSIIGISVCYWTVSICNATLRSGMGSILIMADGLAFTSARTRKLPQGDNANAMPRAGRHANAVGIYM